MASAAASAASIRGRGAAPQDAALRRRGENVEVSRCRGVEVNNGKRPGIIPWHFEGKKSLRRFRNTRWLKMANLVTDRPNVQYQTTDRPSRSSVVT